MIEHLGFSVADLDATMRALAAIGTKVIEPMKATPGLYKTALIESPWGTRVQLVQDPELLGPPSRSAAFAGSGAMYHVAARTSSVASARRSTASSIR